MSILDSLFLGQDAVAASSTSGDAAAAGVIAVVFGLMGLISGLAGFAICSYLSIAKLFFPSEQTSLLARMPMLMLGILLIVLGVQFITMGLLGELIVRVYHESQKKPIYVIREIIG